MGQYVREAQMCNSRIDLAISDLEYLRDSKSYISTSLACNQDVLKDLINEKLVDINKGIDSIIEGLQGLKPQILAKAKEIDDRIEREKEKEKNNS